MNLSQPISQHLVSIQKGYIKSTNFLIVLAGRTETIDTQIKDEQNSLSQTEVNSRKSRGSSFLGLFTLGCVLNIS